MDRQATLLNRTPAQAQAQMPERGISAITGQPFQEMEERQRQAPGVLARGARQGAQLFLSAAPVTGDVMAIQHSVASGREATQALGEGQYKQAALHSAESVLGAIGALPMVPPAVAGILGGFRGARKLIAFDQGHRVSQVGRAAKMESVGENPNLIWKETGWMRGPDKKWRFEISDHKARLSEGFTKHLGPGQQGSQESFMTLGKAFDHEQFFKAYPEARNLAMVVDPRMPAELAAEIQPALGVIRINPNKPAEEVRKTLLHELQHWVQHVEGFSQGSNMMDSAIKFIRVKGPQEARIHAIDQLSNMDRQSRRVLELLTQHNKDLDQVAKQYGRLEPSGTVLFDSAALNFIRSFPAEQQRLMQQAMAHKVSGTYDSFLRHHETAFQNSNRALARLQKQPNQQNLAEALIVTGDAENFYRRSAGEAEARLVSFRADYSPFTREREPPFNPSYFTGATGVQSSELLVNPVKGGLASSRTALNLTQIKPKEFIEVAGSRVRYEGPQKFGDQELHMFTVLDEGKAKGATFASTSLNESNIKQGVKGVLTRFGAH